MNNKTIRVLHILGNLGVGGAESRIMDIYRHIDRNQIQFDFLVHSNTKGFFEDEVKKLGGHIYRVPKFGPKSLFSYSQALNKFFENHSEYKIVHGHKLSSGFIYQNIAKKHNIPVRIAHSRCGFVNIITLENLTKELFKRLTRFYVTHKFAVSQTAGFDAFGKRDVRNGKVTIIPNAINTKKYLYNDSLRLQLRKELKLENSFIVGHIGRFQEQKNHSFLLDIFKSVHSRIPSAILLLIGDGKLKDQIKSKVNQLGLNHNVVFLGIRSDVPDLLQIMDIFLFPSFFEGLPGVILEAQAAGLPCIISDSITYEAKITDLVEYLPLSKDANYWAKKVISFKKGYQRRNTYNEILQAGYDIKLVTKWYENFYITCNCCPK